MKVNFFQRKLQLTHPAWLADMAGKYCLKKTLGLHEENIKPNINQWLFSYGHTVFRGSTAIQAFRCKILTIIQMIRLT